MKIQYEERTYGKDVPEHNKYRAGKSLYYSTGFVACCEKAKEAWTRRIILGFGGLNEEKREVNVATYNDDDEDGYGVWYWEPIIFCPWCAAKVTFECTKKSKVEYDCKEVEEKRTVCEERIVEVPK